MTATIITRAFLLTVLGFLTWAAASAGLYYLRQAMADLSNNIADVLGSEQEAER